jgi:nucleoside permease NupC
VKKLAAVLLGIVVAALLFPTGSVTGCPEGAEDCESRSTSVLVDYAGENGAIGMAIAIGVGIVVALVAYAILTRLGRGRH